LGFLAHISDLHVSHYGDTFHDGRRVVRRSRKPASVVGSVLWEEAGWRLLGSGRKLTLLDPEGYQHAVPKRPVHSPSGDGDIVSTAAQHACRLEARTARTLAKALPSDGALRMMAEHTPNNSNLRLLLARNELTADYVLISGDITDDGEGYELIEAAFAPWAKAGKLLVVPGNHDIFLFPPLGSRRPHVRREQKDAEYRSFAARLGFSMTAGAWWRYLEDEKVMVVGLNSCERAQASFYRHNGAIGDAQLRELREIAALPAWREAKHRLLTLHHHVVPLSPGVGRRAPPEMGMRLDDAKGVSSVLSEIGVDLVLHGHRHVSEERRPAGAKFKILAAPSLTLGCRSGDGPSYWNIALHDNLRTERVEVRALAVHPVLSGAAPASTADLSELDDPSDESA
jgi:3',5'-cyclic-AMP phosphodiesterase